MTGTGMLGERVVDALVSTGAVTAEQLMSAEELAVAEGRSPGTLLLEQGVITAEDVAAALEDALGVPRVDLSSYAPEDAALALVSRESAVARSLLPLFEIDSMLTVAIGDAADVFGLDTLADELGMEVEAVLVEPGSLHEALAAHYGISGAVTPETLQAESAGAPARLESSTGTNAMPVEHAVPAPGPRTEAGEIDLDVLAVADRAKVAVLVADILEHAVAEGASGIHVLPYKDDFFLVYRVGGRLENVASAPLSLQGALVDGFKAFMRVPSAAPGAPALGRMHALIGERELVLTLSAVSTVSGQRLVVSLEADRGLPRDLAGLGMPETERRALHAMVERGRGMLLVCGPVAGGRSSTYYALLAHAALSGRTVYSVERSVQHEIPAVAQVLVSPGSPVGTASYFAAGMAQDTDVIAIDSLQSVEDVHRAIEAAGLGKLVIATFSGGGIVTGVRRMLDLGAEPTSLAAALTFGVGQRLARTNCPDCTRAEESLIAGRIPGASPAMASVAGAGCPSCGGSGFGGLTGLFEVLPFTEAVRAAIATNASAGEIESRAIAAGMRPMVAAGLAKVEEGTLSAEELNRVLRFAE